jgi:hypothetical protein
MKNKFHIQKILNLNDRYAFFLIKSFKKIFLIFEKYHITFDKFQANKAVKHYLQTNDFPILLKNRLSLSDLTDFPTIFRQSKDSIIEEAQMYLQHTFSLLGTEVTFKGKIDWHLDFNSGYHWKKNTYYKKYQQVEINNNIDVKYPRELSRCHHFLVLGQAYLFTEDEKYTIEFIDQISDWISENPYKKSINWGCSMDVAIRASNWIFALGMFLNSPKISSGFIQKILFSLYLHGKYIYGNPEKNYLQNHNHFLADLAGQILLGLIFKEMQDPKLWLEDGIYSFYKEIRSQILPSGPSYERSTNYHRLVTELITYSVIILKNNKFQIPQDILYRLHQMFLFIMNYTKPDKMTPVIGDQDNGRYLPFSQQETCDHRYLLTLGAIMFQDSSLKSLSSGISTDAYFLLKEQKAIETFESLKDKNHSLSSISYPDAGFYIMRHSDDYMFINISGLSHYNENNSGTHTHSDLLSFELAVDGISFLVDPGSYVYSQDASMRMFFRSTAMHNTVTIDEKSQHTLDRTKLWWIENDATVKNVRWDSDDKQDVFCAEHDGYFKLTEPVTHRREIIFSKDKEVWEIIDSFSGKGKHTFISYLHFDVGVDVTVNNQTIFAVKEKKKIEIELTASHKINISKDEGCVSKSYGIKNDAWIVAIEMHSDVPCEINTKIQKVLNK